MPKYSVKTLWTICVVRAYYVDAENPDEAEEIIWDFLEKDNNSLQPETESKGGLDLDAIVGVDLVK